MKTKVKKRNYLCLECDWHGAINAHDYLGWRCNTNPFLFIERLHTMPYFQISRSSRGRPEYAGSCSIPISASHQYRHSSVLTVEVCLIRREEHLRSHLPWRQQANGLGQNVKILTLGTVVTSRPVLLS